MASKSTNTKLENITYLAEKSLKVIKESEKLVENGNYLIVLEQFFEVPLLNHIAQIVLENLEPKDIANLRLASKTLKSYIDKDWCPRELKKMFQNERVACFQHLKFIKFQKYHLEWPSIYDYFMKNEFGRFTFLQLMVEYFNTNLNFYESPAHFAIRQNKPKTIEVLMMAKPAMFQTNYKNLRLPNKCHKSLMTLACQTDKVDIIKTLVTLAINVLVYKFRE